MQWQEVGILLALYSPIIVPSCTFHRLARVVLSRKSFCCVYCGKRPMEWKRKRGRAGRSRMNELLKSVKKERRKCNEDEKLCNVYTSLVDHRTTSSSHEKWIENVKRRVMYYICNDIPCDLTSFRGRVIFFFFFRFFSFRKSLHFVLTWPLRSYDITFTCTRWASHPWKREHAYLSWVVAVHARPGRIGAWVWTSGRKHAVARNNRVWVNCRV